MKAVGKYVHIATVRAYFAMAKYHKYKKEIIRWYAEIE